MALGCYCADTDAHLIHAPDCPEMNPNANIVQIKSKLSLESFIHLGFTKHACMKDRPLTDLPDLEQYPFPRVD